MSIWLTILMSIRSDSTGGQPDTSSTHPTVRSDSVPATALSQSFLPWGALARIGPETDPRQAMKVSEKTFD